MTIHVLLVCHTILQKSSLVSVEKGPINILFTLTCNGSLFFKTAILCNHNLYSINVRSKSKVGDGGLGRGLNLQNSFCGLSNAYIMSEKSVSVDQGFATLSLALSRFSIYNHICSYVIINLIEKKRFNNKIKI